MKLTTIAMLACSLAMCSVAHAEPTKAPAQATITLSEEDAKNLKALINLAVMARGLDGNVAKVGSYLADKIDAALANPSAPVPAGAATPDKKN